MRTFPPKIETVRNSGGHRAILLPGLLWLALLLLATVAAASGATGTAPGEPPLLILAFVLVPPVLFLLAHEGSTHVRTWVMGLDLTAVTLMQSWRIAGLLFLPLAYYGHLSYAFAVPAGLGDALVGLLAPFVALAVERRGPRWREASYGLVALGLADFVVAVGMGALVSSGALAPYIDPGPEPALGVLPLSLVPTALVPAWIMLHLIVWLRVRRA